MPDDEDEKERLNRKLIELLNEVRVALPGVQVLFGFLLILPFNSRFVRTNDLEQAVYAVALSAAAVASALLIASTAYHRHRFARLAEETVSDKEEMIATQDHFVIGGLVFLAIAMGGAVFVIFDLVFGNVIASILSIALILVFGWFWYALPLSRRLRAGSHPPEVPTPDRS
ncbi:MAG: DUF6328 family protein [Candidatus Velamenicoccus archaeovorus]